MKRVAEVVKVVVPRYAWQSLSLQQYDLWPADQQALWDVAAEEEVVMLAELVVLVATQQQIPCRHCG